MRGKVAGRIPHPAPRRRTVAPVPDFSMLTTLTQYSQAGISGVPFDNLTVPPQP